MPHSERTVPGFGMRLCGQVALPGRPTQTSLPTTTARAKQSRIMLIINFLRNERSVFMASIYSLAAGVLIEKPDWVIEQTNGAWA